MDTGGERKTTAEELEGAEPGAVLKLRQPARGDTQLLSETWGCERRCDVDLGSSHDDGWSRSRYHSLIGQIEGVIQLLFFSYGPCGSEREREREKKRTTQNFKRGKPVTPTMPWC